MHGWQHGEQPLPCAPQRCRSHDIQRQAHGGKQQEAPRRAVLQASKTSQSHTRHDMRRTSYTFVLCCPSTLAHHGIVRNPTAQVLQHNPSITLESLDLGVMVRIQPLNGPAAEPHGMPMPREASKAAERRAWYRMIPMTPSWRIARRLICTMRTRTGRGRCSLPGRPARAAAAASPCPHATPTPGTPAHIQANKNFKGRIPARSNILIRLRSQQL